MANKKRLIDANALEFEPYENFIANGVLIWGGRSGGKTMTTVLSALKVMIDKAPTVDAVEVVRCKDCKSYDEDFHWCDSRCIRMYEDDFCSYGERKSDG